MLRVERPESDSSGEVVHVAPPAKADDSSSDIADAATRPRRCTPKRIKCCAGVCVVLALITIAFFLGIYWSAVLTSISAYGVLEADFKISADFPAAVERFENSTIRVMSLNAFLRSNFVSDKIGKTKGHNDFKDERTHAITELFDAYDVLLLQETWLPMDSLRKAKLIKTAHDKGLAYHLRSSLLRGGLVDGMLLVLSRYPIEFGKEETYSDASGIDKLASKGVLGVKISTPHSCGNFVAFTTHLQADGPDDVIRYRQLTQLGEFIAEFDSQHPDITRLLTGDFNLVGWSNSTWQPSPMYAEIIERLDVLPQHDLVDVNYASTSYTHMLPSKALENAHESKVLAFDSDGDTIDYCFLYRRPGSWSVDSFTSGPLPFEYQKEDLSIALSDHFAQTFSMQCAP